MKDRQSRSDFYDTIGGHQNIYTLDGEQLRAFDVSGGKIAIVRRTWDAGCNGGCWFVSDGDEYVSLSGSVLLTNK